MKTKKFKKGKTINFQVGDLVIPNFELMKVEPFDCLYLVLKVEEAEHTQYLWWENPMNIYVHLTLKEVKTEREIAGLAVVNNGSELCEYLIVD